MRIGAYYFHICWSSGLFPGGEDRAVPQGQNFRCFGLFHAHGNIRNLWVAIYYGISAVVHGPFKIGVKYEFGIGITLVPAQIYVVEDPFFSNGFRTLAFNRCDFGLCPDTQNWVVVLWNLTTVAQGNNAYDGQQ